MGDRKIGVTGANGFVGAAVARLLLGCNVQVTGLFGATPESRFPADLFPSITADICNGEEVAHFVRDQDTIVHLAGPPSVAASFANPAEYVRVHSAGTACVLAEAVKAKVRRFVYVSSAEVYGHPGVEYVEEDHPLQARSPYAAAKIGAEKLVEAAQFGYGLQTVILRPFSVYGPGASPDSVLSRIARLARASQPILLNDLSPLRDYCYVEDVARAVAMACKTGAIGKTFNIGTMRPTSVGELANVVLQVLGMSLPVGERGGGGGSRPTGSDISRLVADHRRAATELRWSPTWTLEDGLKRMLSQE